jgi:hypothetical protein
MSWITWHGDRVIQRFRQASMDALESAVERVGQVSDQQVPHDEGWLQASKTIIRDDAKGQVAIGYGGGGNSGFPEVPYAVKWHEIPANFQKGRKHNYLRDPVKTELPKWIRHEFRLRGVKA